MSKNYDELIKNIDKNTLEVAKTITENRNSENFDSIVFGALQQLVVLYGTEEYSFNLSMEKLVQTTAPLIKDSLIRLLHNNLPEVLTMFDTVDNIEALFACYYSLSLVYKKDEDVESLGRLISEQRYQSLARFPLIYEVHSRYYKRIGELRKALGKDQYAINILAGYTPPIENYGVCISYASTVCSMLEHKCEVFPAEIKNAIKYVDKAIEYNPKYAKYYFIKAKLLYYTSYNLELQDLESIYNTVIDLIEGKAKVNLFFEPNVHREKEEQKYDNFINSVRQDLSERKRASSAESFLELTTDEAQSIKHRIINSTHREEETLPMVPKLCPDDKYIFVCYSSMDYKSVYCDLVEFYVNKIPFKYDNKLTPGKGWNPQVEKQIVNPNCVGVVFYISKNTLISKGLCEEIKMVCCELKKPYFAVNLEGDLLPSRIMIDTILDVYNKDKSTSLINTEHILHFLQAFNDTQVFTAKHKLYGENGAKHIPSFIDAARTRFGLIIQRKN